MLLLDFFYAFGTLLVENSHDVQLFRIVTDVIKHIIQTLYYS